MKCRCRIGTIKASRNPDMDDHDEATIVFCPLHAAAEETANERDRLRAALEMLTDRDVRLELDVSALVSAARSLIGAKTPEGIALATYFLQISLAPFPASFNPSVHP